ncbi:MAG TPA: hypothetical protein VK034_08990 [Enhygromyxa sp.]|nr:hypothetical protein [Enhygromyxa sp.]
MSAAKTLAPNFAVEPAREQGRPLAELAAPGRIVELCGQAQTTAAVMLLAQVQREGETAAWIQLARGDLFPPDLAAAGVDVEALVVVHVPDRDQADRSPAAGQCRAAELLLRSGAFGLVILDFGRGEPRGSTAWQGRLLGLARQHEARVVILRERTSEVAESSLGPLTGLRIASWIEPSRRADDPPGFTPRTGCFTLRHEVLKNKSGGPVEPAPAQIRGPWGYV